MKMEIPSFQEKEGDKGTGCLQNKWLTKTAMATRNLMTSKEGTKTISQLRCMETEENNRPTESLCLERRMESSLDEGLCSGKTIKTELSISFACKM